MPSLRDALEEIVNGGALSVSEHPAAIARLAPRFPHSIRHIKEEPERRYNCFMLALGLLQNDRVYDILQKDALWCGFADVKVGPEYVDRLIHRAVLVRDDSGPLIIYLSNDKPVHAGLVVGKGILSKWGIGLLWEHEVWEVPRSYGDVAERYALIRPDLVQSEFEEYADALVAAKGGYPD